MASETSSIKSPNLLSREFLNFVFNGPIQFTPRQLHSYENNFQHGRSCHSVVVENLRWMQIYLAKGMILPSFFEILSAKYRALDYLYGAREATPVDELSSNPLVDVLMLIAPSCSYNADSSYQWCVIGPPQYRELFNNEKPDLKQTQYSNAKNKLGEKRTFRTLSQFGEYQRTVGRGLYVFAQMTDRYPELVRQTLDEYVSIATHDEGNTTGMAVGLLELLFNMNLLTDSRFTTFSQSLRKVVIEDMGSYDVLKTQYFYRVIEYSPFWLEGEKEIQKNKAILYGGERTDVEAEEMSSLVFPGIGGWDHAIRNRHADLEEISRLTPVNSVMRSAQRSTRTLDTYATDIRESMRKKAELVEAVRLQNQRLPFTLRKSWEEWLEVFSQKRITTPSDELVMKEAAQLIMNYFVKDRTFSQKAIGRLKSPDSFYTIDAEVLTRDPLHNWIFSLRDNLLAGGLENAVTNQPAEFSLLLRLMTYDVGARFFRKKETNLLYDAHYKEKADSDSLVELVRNLRGLVNRKRPDVKNIFLQALEGSDQKITDLMDKKRMKRVQKNLNTLTYDEPIPFVRVNKSPRMTRRSFLKLVSGLGALYILKSLGSRYIELFASNKEQNPSNQNNDSNQPEIIQKRIPDAISAQEVKELKPFFFGQIIHLPSKYFSEKEGEAIGYFPTAWLARDEFEHEYESGYANRKDLGQIKPLDVITVNSLSNSTLQFQQDQLVVSPTIITHKMFPPVGWRTIRVIQEQGSTPNVGSVGQILFDEGFKQPERLWMVLEKIPQTELYLGNVRATSSAIMYFTGADMGPLTFGYSLEKARQLNEQLAGDPDLQELHKSFVDEVHSIAIELERYDPERVSQVGIK